jgi:hypothetical protein
MRTTTPLLQPSILGALVVAILASPLVPGTVFAQDSLFSNVPPQGQTVAQLKPLVAPIALYPDPLVAQVLQASTYPDQVSEASEYVTMHPAQSPDNQPWDASVIAVSHYPPVLQMMAKQIHWTQQLGRTYLAQQGPVLQAIQSLRQEAMNMGNLKATSQQQVTNSNGTIQIYPTDPSVLYVPTYDPVVVYDEAPMWGAAPLVGFGTGWAVGTAMAGTSVDWIGGTIVNYPPGYGWSSAYSNGNYRGVVGQTASGVSYAGQSTTSTLARGGEVTRYQGGAVGWNAAESGSGTVYSKGNTDVGTFSRTVTTSNGTYNINGVAGTNGTSSNGVAEVTDTNRDGDVTHETVTDHYGDITTTRDNDLFDTHPESDNVFSDAHNEDWRSDYADRGAWSRGSFDGGGFRGGGFRR